MCSFVCSCSVLYGAAVKHIHREVSETVPTLLLPSQHASQDPRALAQVSVRLSQLREKERMSMLEKSCYICAIKNRLRMSIDFREATKFCSFNTLFPVCCYTNFHFYVLYSIYGSCSRTHK